MASTVEIVINAKDKASGTIKSVGSELGKLGKIAGTLAGLGAAGFLALGKEALEVTADYEKLKLSLQSLAATELIRNNNAEDFSAILDKQTGMTDKQIDKYISLRSQYDLLKDKMQAIAASGGATPDYMVQQSAKLHNAIIQLIPDFASLPPHLQAAALGVLDMGEAMLAASPKAEELLKFVEQLAIKSPFDEAGIKLALQTMMGMGMVSDMAQEMTANIVDWAAASGKGNEEISRVALNLAQIQSAGKVTGQELRELALAGIPVNDILASMGFTAEDVSKGLVKADDFLGAFNNTMDEFYEGSAEKFATSWSGILSTLDELKKKGLRTLFKGIFDELQPLVAKFAEWLSGDGLKKLEAWGSALGGMAKDLINAAQGMKGMDFVTLTDKFEDWAKDVDWQKVSNDIIDGLNNVDWNNIGLQIRGGVKNILDGLRTIGGEVDWAGIGAALADSSNAMFAGLFGYETFDQLVVDFWAGWDYFVSLISAPETWVAIGESIKQASSQLFASLFNQENFDKLVSAFWAGWGTITAVVMTAYDQLKTAFMEKANDFLEAGGKFAESIATGFENTAGAIIAVVQSIIDTIIGMFSSTISFITGGNSGGGGGGAPAQKATGGPVSASTPYIVGERGPELFVPYANGTIIPNNELVSAGAGAGGGSGGGMVVNLTYAPALSTVSAQELQDILLPFIKTGIMQARKGV